MFKANAGLLILLLTASALTAKDKAAMPKAIVNAKYVWVTTYEGDVFNPEVLPDDRHAVFDVEDAITKWGRYQIVDRRGEADLILIVRTGRVIETKLGVGIARPRGSQRAIGAETGDPEDTLDVFLASQGPASIPLWRARATNGLKPPKMPLFVDFRSKVDAAEKKP